MRKGTELKSLVNGKHVAEAKHWKNPGQPEIIVPHWRGAKKAKGAGPISPCSLISSIMPKGYKLNCKLRICYDFFAA